MRKIKGDQLAFPTQSGGADKGFFLSKTMLIDQLPRCKIIGAINDNIEVIRQYFGTDFFGVTINLQIGI